MSLNAKNLGLAGGFMWGASMLVLTLVSMRTGYATGLLEAIAGLYIGYSVSLLGSLVGLVYGFLDAFVGLYLFALLYNWLEAR
jgi:hypothetical protein